MKYLKNITITGYKSLKSVDVSLGMGINVFIGQNSSGKTNLLQFISKLHTDFVKFESDVAFSVERISGNDSFFIDFKQVIDFNRKFENRFSFDEFEKFNSKITIYKNRKLEFDFKFNFFEEFSDFVKLPFYKDYVLSLVQISSVEFYNSKSIRVLDQVLDIRAVNMNSIWEELEGVKLFKPELIYCLTLIFERVSKEGKVNSDAFDVVNNMFVSRVSGLISDLSTFTLIQDIRISDTFKLSIQNDGIVAFDSIRIQFKIDGIWRNWSELSHGSKRLVTIFYKVAQEKSDVCLIDEPELGIHPHQLKKLMEFLNFHANDKQIIVSTHSPDVLDCLNIDEIDKINIVKIEKGSTRVEKLTEFQKKKAKDYYDTIGSIGDYWKHSDLEL